MGIASSTVDPALRTRAFARVIGPFVATVTTIIAVRAGDLGFLGDSFFRDPMWSWLFGALLFFCGLMIIAFHQFWRGAAAVIISLFGWFLALRGLVLLAFPGLMRAGVDASVPAGGRCVASSCSWPWSVCI
ncbi:membrane protein [Mycobacteroides abscessus]|nr:membrane protein [Mycobacteroides abscessus]